MDFGHDLGEREEDWQQVEILDEPEDALAEVLCRLEKRIDELEAAVKKIKYFLVLT